MTRALVVEDYDDTREQLAALFRREGCEVEEARNGMAAMGLFWAAHDRGKPFKLIVLDLALPKMDGLSVAQRIRDAESKTDDLPKAFLCCYTGHPEHLLSEEALRRARLDKLVRKPGDPDEWKKLIRELADEKGC